MTVVGEDFSFPSSGTNPILWYGGRIIPISSGVTNIYAESTTNQASGVQYNILINGESPTSVKIPFSAVEAQIDELGEGINLKKAIITNNRMSVENQMCIRDRTPSDILYDDWSDLMTHIGTLDGPTTIYIEQDETIPAGTWDVNNITIQGSFNPAGSPPIPRLFLADGAIFDFTALKLDMVSLYSDSTTPVVVTPTATLMILEAQDCTFSTSDAPVFEIESGGMFGLWTTGFYGQALSLIHI